MKRSGNQLPRKANFRTFVPLNISKFRLEQCEMPLSYQKCQKKKKKKKNTFEAV